MSRRGPAVPLIGAAVGLLLGVAVTLLQDSTYRADVVVLEGAGLVLGEDDDLASPFCESLEQPLDPPSDSGSGGKLINPPGRRSASIVSDASLATQNPTRVGR